MSPDANPLSILVTPAEIAGWNVDGLPSDRVSTENGCVVANTERWPLFIDPQLQGIKWICEKEKNNNLAVVRLGQKDLLRKLEMAMENGWSLVIENMGERVDAILQPVIGRSTIRKGRKLYIKLGDTEVELAPTFKLIMHTKLSNPHYPPEIQAEAALINFAVTEAGLEDQLLSDVVLKERPDLAEQSKFLVEQQQGFKILIQQLEDEILHKLNTAEGDVTEDVELIEGLENAKRISVDIAAKAIIANETEAAVNETNEKYRSVAARGALVFFIMNDMFKVHTYYIYSLAAFKVVFLRGIDLTGSPPEVLQLVRRVAERKQAEALAAGDAEKKAENGGDEDREEGEDAADEAEVSADAAGDAEDGGGAKEDKEGEDGEEGEEAPAAAEEEEVEEMPEIEVIDEAISGRCLALIDVCTKTIFEYIRRGLFERDKLTIATKLALSILLKEEKIEPAKMRFVVYGGEVDGVARPDAIEWLPEVCWRRVKYLESFKKTFSDGDSQLIPSITDDDPDAWRLWFDDPFPETKPYVNYKCISASMFLPSPSLPFIPPHFPPSLSFALCHPPSPSATLNPLFRPPPPTPHRQVPKAIP